MTMKWRNSPEAALSRGPLLPLLGRYVRVGRKHSVGYWVPYSGRIGVIRGLAPKDIPMRHHDWEQLPPGQPDLCVVGLVPGKPHIGIDYRRYDLSFSTEQAYLAQLEKDKVSTGLKVAKLGRSQRKKKKGGVK